MTTHKGIYYWNKPKAAREWAWVNGWPTTRVTYYKRGWAVQAGDSGNYAGPDTKPKPYDVLTGE
tara:strand:+ start:107 stop:298 length:192 start_codon:yes stop_codon:yes gene_type:complete